MLSGVVKQQNIATAVLATRWSPWQSSYSPPLRTYQHNTKNTSVLNGYLLKSRQLGWGGGGEEGEKCKPSMPPCYISSVKPLP